MNRIELGLVCGLVFGLLDVALMLPMSLPDKRTAITAAFLDRLAIGFLICVVNLPLPAWVSGVLVALLISLPSALVTKSYTPILGIGIVGGAVIGVIAARFGR
jgi:hypothetical protein